MWRTILSKKIAEKHKIDYKEAHNFVNMVIKEMEKTLKAGHEIKMPNFGVFFMRQKVERLARNPKTLEPYVVSKRSVAGIKYSRIFKDNIRREVKP